MIYCCASAEPRLHAALDSAAKVMRCCLVVICACLVSFNTLTLLCDMKGI